MDCFAQCVLQGLCIEASSQVCDTNHQQGYLDIVRWLCELGGAHAEFNGAPGVDIRSRGGWTPLSK